MTLILITRPAAEAQEYAQELRELGYQTLTQPMLEIVPQDFEMPDVSGYQALIFTSGNGVRMLAAKSKLRNIPVFTVGDQTRAAALQAGFIRVSSASGTASDLVSLVLQSSLDKTRPLLHVRGYHAATPIHILLQEHGFSVDLAVVYKAALTTNLSPDCVHAIRENRITAIPFFSKRTAENFLDLVQKNGLASHLSNIKALSISQSVLECVRPSDWGSVHVSDAPDKTSLTKLLQRVCAP